jgi:ubiquinone/menaquinone biosynthesis C-methylase UbiE
VRTLTHEEARRLYDRIGSRQDTQAFYEDRANDQLVRHAKLGKASSVFEFGCGTGRFAHRLLSEHLSPDALYCGFDLSPTMVRLAQQRLAPFGPRAEVVLTDGKLPIDRPSESIDRFLSTFVFDLLSEEDIEGVVHEAHRMLKPGGLICLSSLSTGSGAASRVIAAVWSRIHALHPALVGGCRPLDLLAHLPSAQWQVHQHGRLAPFGLPSDAVVAERQ